MADEIMKEMWRIKDELAARFSDLDSMFRHYQQKPRESGWHYVRLVKKLKNRRPARARASGDR